MQQSSKNLVKTCRKSTIRAAGSPLAEMAQFRFSNIPLESSVEP